MTISQIYSEFSIGSEGFCIAVETHCGYEISREEIERIAALAPTSEQFQSVWENDESWVDANN